MSYPNTLTIFLNTRIRGYSKIRYDPAMSDPKSDNENVSFNPVIKLNKKAINDVPPNEKYKQFFKKNYFQSLVNRSISNSPQRNQTIDQASKNGTVDNNIQLILDTIFKNNNILYINDKPYTIFSHEWLKGDWVVDKKGFQKKITASPYGRGYGTNIYNYNYNYSINTFDAGDDELTKFEKEHPGAVRGALVSSSSSKFNNGLIANPSINKSLQQQTIKQLKKAFVANNLPKSMKNLINLNIINDDFLNTSASNLSNNPLSVSLVYASDLNYSNEIKLYSSLKYPYSDLQKSMDNLNDANKKYYSLLPSADLTFSSDIDPNNIFINKKTYDDVVEKLVYIIDKFKKKKKRSLKAGNSNTTIVQLKSKMESFVFNLRKYKQDFLEAYLESLKLLLNKVEAQKEYMTKLVAFYDKLNKSKDDYFAKKGVRDEYQNKLIISIIGFDSNCYDIVLYHMNDVNSPLYKKIEAIKVSIETAEQYIKDNKIKNKNDREMTNDYYLFPKLLKIEKYQLEILVYNALRLEQEITNDVWNIVNAHTVKFMNELKDSMTNFNPPDNNGCLVDLKQILDDYNGRYIDPVQNKEFMDKVMKLNETNPILETEAYFPPSSFKKKLSPTYQYKYNELQVVIQFKFTDQASRDRLYEYIDLQKKIQEGFDYITTFVRVSAITYSRQISYFTTLRNINNIHEKIYQRTLDSLDIIQNNQPMWDFIPSYPFLLKDKYPDDATVQKFIKHNSNLLDQIRNVTDPNIELRLSRIEDSFNEKFDSLLPYISSYGVSQNCWEITDDTGYKASKMSGPPLPPGSGARPYVSSRRGRGGPPPPPPPPPGPKPKPAPKPFVPPGDAFDFDALNKQLSAWNLRYDMRQSQHFQRFLQGLINEGIANKTISDGPDSIKKHGDELAFWNILEAGAGGDCFFYSIAGIENINYYVSGNPTRINMRQVRDEFANNINREQLIGLLTADETYPDAHKLFDHLIDHAATDAARGIDGDSPIVPVADFEEQMREILRTPGIFWAEETAVTVLERFTRTKIIIINQRVVGGNVVFSIYNLAYGQEDYDNAVNINHYMFILNIDEAHYQFPFNAHLKRTIFTFDNMPDYMKYFIYKDCWLNLSAVSKGESWFGHNPAFRDYFDNMDLIYNAGASVGGKAISDRKAVVGRQSGGGILINTGMYSKVGHHDNVISYEDPSKLSYYVVIDLELYPGESIPLSKRPIVACQTQYEKIRHAYADTFGLLYQPLETNFKPTSKQEEEESNEKKSLKDELEDKIKDKMKDRAKDKIKDAVKKAALNTLKVKYGIPFGGGKMTRRNH
jgi:hypothetical protein